MHKKLWKFESRKKIIIKEMKALEKNEIWSATILPTWKRTIRCKRVFTLKYNYGGSIEVYKARLLLKGFTQAYGID